MFPPQAPVRGEVDRRRLNPFNSSRANLCLKSKVHIVHPVHKMITRIRIFLARGRPCFLANKVPRVFAYRMKQF